MTMTDSERRAWGRGYNTGAKWPPHLPPQPPNEIFAAVITAGRNMRGFLDTQIATGGHEESECGPYIDDFDRAMEQLGIWLKQNAGD